MHQATNHQTETSTAGHHQPGKGDGMERMLDIYDSWKKRVLYLAGLVAAAGHIGDLNRELRHGDDVIHAYREAPLADEARAQFGEPPHDSSGRLRREVRGEHLFRACTCQHLSSPVKHDRNYCYGMGFQSFIAGILKGGRAILRRASDKRWSRGSCSSGAAHSITCMAKYWYILSFLQLGEGDME